MSEEKSAGKSDIRLKFIIAGVALLCCFLIGVGLRRIIKQNDAKREPAIEESFRDWEATIGNNNSVIHNRSEAVQHLRRGRQLENQQDWQGALLVFNEAIRLFPRYRDAYAERALCRQHLNDLSGAVEDANLMVKLDPSNYKTWAARGEYRCRAGDVQGGISDLTESIDIYPSEPVLCDRGDAKVIVGDGSALHDYHAALRINPTSVRARDGIIKCQQLLQH